MQEKKLLGVTIGPADEARFKTAIAGFCIAAHMNSVTKGFWEGLKLPEMTLTACPDCGEDYQEIAAAMKASKIALMHSELSEMLEGIRKPGPDSHCPQFTQEEIELADVFIRGADYAEARGLRLAEAILAKMHFNASRPHKHGKAI
jgi:NTP pyrophosphatase (non-canonical NTP hydrolase)